MELLEEEYKTQQNMIINHTSKYETLNHLLNQIVIIEDNRNSIDDINYSVQDKDTNDINNIINSENNQTNNYVNSEELLANKYKANNNQITNLNTGSGNNLNNNDSMDSGNSNRRKKKFIYTKILSYNTNREYNAINIIFKNNLENSNHKTNNYLDTNREKSENNQKDNINFNNTKNNYVGDIEDNENLENISIDFNDYE